MKRIKEYFKALKTIFRYNLFSGYICPECSTKKDYNYYMPASMRFLWDEKYHKYKYYIKCHCCKKTTPAFSELKKVFEIWDDYFIAEECKIMENI